MFMEGTTLKVLETDVPVIEQVHVQYLHQISFNHKIALYIYILLAKKEILTLRFKMPLIHPAFATKQK